MYESIVLEDLGLILSSKTDIIELLIREYDLIHYYESELNNKDNKYNVNFNKVIRNISLAK
jgi:hypothetical protein